MRQTIIEWFVSHGLINCVFKKILNNCLIIRTISYSFVYLLSVLPSISHTFMLWLLVPTKMTFWWEFFSTFTTWICVYDSFMDSSLMHPKSFLQRKFWLTHAAFIFDTFMNALFVLNKILFSVQFLTTLITFIFNF